MTILVPFILALYCLIYNYLRDRKILTSEPLFSLYKEGLHNGFHPNVCASNVWHFYVPLLPVWIFEELEPGSRAYVPSLVWLRLIRRRMLVSMKNSQPCWEYQHYRGKCTETTEHKEQLDDPE